jgi:hypothetical protein
MPYFLSFFELTSRLIGAFCRCVTSAARACASLCAAVALEAL